ncbi:hypothetical protein MF672_007880 [Actinomadura sp. ATCC 31491]|uniref:Uncharacterized protein n=1 Tax=Actinomadura luzonensis TaxID=2805427 RepID=A0ABT0FN75_9ACTN|nr:hypothetical protein [Actinomadura luzonensis]MCK2213704.1 hypothetical protein [Actinomadura luzonensis]
MQARTHLYDLLVSTLFTEGLDGDTDLWALGFTAVWVKDADLGALAATDHAIDDGSRWVAEAGGWTAVIPAQADREVVRSLSEDGREAIGLSMDINYNASLVHARDGRVTVSFDPSSPAERYDDTESDDPGELVEVDESISSALALIGRVTGTDVAADWFQARHSRVEPAS